jgi:hypothetical protein|tara:strand:+ start:33 stop:575 length:543 start_codon:yes stop_codon:yes gene_type:complete
MDNDLRTEVWDGKIEYHTYTQVGWLAIGGPTHPLFQTLLNRTLSESQHISDYKLYVIGGLLEDWVSWDIDLAIIGEYDPLKIKEIFETITKISFELRIFTDLHFQKELWPIDLYSKYGGYEQEHECIRLSNNFKNNDVRQDLSGLIPIDGLYKQTISYPFPKHIKRKSEGYMYKAPLLLN